VIAHRNYGAAAITFLAVASSLQPLSAQGTGTITGTVTSARTSAPISGVTVRIVGGQRVAVTRADGSYRLSLGAGAYELRATAIGFAPVSRAVTVMADHTSIENFALHESAVSLDEVVTIGTRRVDRTATGSPVPIDVVSAAALRGTGFVETWQALQRLVPSVNVPRIPLGDTHVRPLTLRGLAPDHVLVLVNGKRRHSAAVVQGGPVLSGSVPVDIGAIPFDAIERIEVLRDGASAQYGSDAIAGVVNLVLKAGERREGRASFGGTYTSEGGRHFRDGNVANVSATYGALYRRGAQLTVSAGLSDRGRTNRAYPDARQQYFAGDPRNGDAPVISSAEGDGEARAIGSFVSVGIPLRHGGELYAFGGASQRDGRAAVANFRRANDFRTVRALHPNGFLADIGTDLLDFSGAAGVRGAAGGWRWDLSSVFGGNSVRYNVHNSNNVSLGAASPTEFYAGRLGSSQWTSNVDVARPLKIGLREPASLAMGAEFRVDGYRIEAGEPDSYRDGGVPVIDGDSAGRPAQIGAQGLLGFRPLDEVTATRNNIAAYVGLESRVARRLVVDLAARAERYSDYGSRTAGKLAVRLEPFRGVAIRGAAGSGFRAPSLGQSHYSTTRGIVRLVSGVNTPFVVRTLPVNSTEARVLGAKPLRPESSRSVSAGIIVDFPAAPTVTVDYYAIKVDDRITPSGEFVAPAVRQLFEQQGLRGIAGGRYFTNAVDTKTRGVDVVGSYGLLLARGGVLRLTGGYNARTTRVVRVSLAPPQLEAFQSTLFNRAEEGKIEVGQPRTTSVLTATYTLQRLALNLHNQRFGEASLLDLNDPQKDQTVRAKWIADLGGSYQVGRRLSLAATVSNLFDVYPDEWWDFRDGVSAQGMSNSGIFRYPGGISPFGMNGRTIYVHMAYR